MPLFRLLPKEAQYFTAFAQMATHINEAAWVLVEMLADDGGDRDGYADKIKAIEDACDKVTHSVSTRLNTSLAHTFDREDVYLLSRALDDIVDLIDDVARAMVMYDVHESTPHARHFADVIQRMASELNRIVPRLEKAGGVTLRLVEMHRLENEGDDIYAAAVAELFQQETEPLVVIKWKDIYEKLEAAVDRFELVANIIEGIIIKHK